MSKRVSVLHVDGGRRWGGGQNQVRLLMRELEKLGVEQLCICPRGSPLADRLKAAGLPVRPVRWQRGGVDPRAVFRIARELKDRTVVHCHDAHSLQLALVPAKLRGVRIIAARRVGFATRAIKWNRADRVIAISEAVREKLLASGVDEHRIALVHSGVDVEESRALAHFSPTLREQLGIPDDAFVAGNTGHLFPFKEQVRIPEAASLLRDVHWIIAGEGPQRGAIEEAIAKFDVAQNVHLAGWIDDARRLMHEIDVYVSPATDEALGTSILEAMARGVPVIAARRAGPAEILAPIHERTGVVLVEALDAQALANSVAMVRGNPELRARIVVAQNERLHDFTSRITAALTLRIYEEVLRDE